MQGTLVPGGSGVPFASVLVDEGYAYMDRRIMISKPSFCTLWLHNLKYTSVEPLLAAKGKNTCNAAV